MKTSTIRQLTLCSLALLVGVWHSTAADTAGGASGPAVQLEEVTLTATRVPRAVSLTPEQVNVIGLEELQQLVVQDFEDIFKYEVGVTISGGPRGIGQRPNIRGLGGARVLQRVDGARMDFNSGHKGQAFIEPAWLQRVEVIRGPASAMFGSGGLGGTVNMRTVEAGDFLGEGENSGARLQTGFQGANREFGVIPMLYGKLNGEKIEYLFSYNGRWSGPINTGGDEPTLRGSSEELNSGLAKLVYRPFEGTTFKFGSMNFSSGIGVPPNTSTTGPTLVDRSTRQSIHNLEFEHSRPDTRWLDLQGNLYYSTMNIHEVQNTDGRVDDVDFSTIGLNVLNRQALLEENNAASLHLTYGVEYFAHDQQSTRNGGANVFFPNAESDHVAGYAQTEIGLLDGHLDVIPGVRIDSVNNDGAAGFNNKETAVSPKVGAVVDIGHQLNLREGDYVKIGGSYSEGFRSPSFSELFATGAHFAAASPFAPSGAFAANPALRPETSSNWEIGPRVKINRFKGSFNYFETSAEDFIDFTVGFSPFPPPGGTLTFTPVNVAEARLRGVEIEGRIDLNDKFDFWGNYTRVRGENPLTGAPLTSVAPDRITLGLDYTLAEYGIMTGIRVSHNAKQDDLPAGTPPSHEYAVVDLMLSWRPGRARHDFGWLKRWELNLGIDNVLDRGYRPFLAGLPEAGINPKATVAYRWTF